MSVFNTMSRIFFLSVWSQNFYYFFTKIFKVTFLVSKFEIIDAFDGLFIVCRTIFNWENILSAGVLRYLVSWGQIRDILNVNFWALKCKNHSAPKFYRGLPFYLLSEYLFSTNIFIKLNPSNKLSLWFSWMLH